MSRLQTLFEELNFAGVETFIASGNVIFSCQSTHTGTLESRIAEHLATSLGYEVDTFVRTAEEVAEIGRARIFPDDGREGIIIHVGFLPSALSKETDRKLASLRTATDEFRVVNRELYWLYRGHRTSDSKVWTLPELKALRLPTMTMRNLTSIRKLIAKHIA
jgi:uncharacterized protein (DUF1697 family)